MTVHSTIFRALPVFLLAAMLNSTVIAQQEDPAEAIDLYNTAANLFGDKDYQLAIGQYVRLLNDYPEFSRKRDAQHYMALAHYNLQEYQKAVEHFTALRDSLPNIQDFRRSEKMLLYLAFSQYQLGKAADGINGADAMRDALKTYKQFFENFATSDMAAQARFYQGEAFYELNRVDESADTLGNAAAAYKKVVDEHPENEIRRRAQFAYGTCLEEMGEFVEANNVYTRFLDEFPDDSKADEIRLRKADTLVQQGIAAKNSGDPQQASEYFQQADQIYKRLTDNPEFPAIASAKNQRAYCLLLLGQFGSAADLYATIANDHPEFAMADDAALDAGKYYFTAGKMDLAEQWLDKVVKDVPQHRAEATHWLCRIKIENKEFDSALELANNALATDPGNHEINLQMDSADALYNIPDRRAEAIAAYQKVASDHPTHSVAPKALYYAAFGQMSVGEHQQAIELARRFQEAHADSELLPDTLEVLAQAALKDKQLPLAETTFRDLVTRFTDHPRHDWWQTRVGWASYLQGNYDDAIGWLSQSVLKLKDAVSVSEAHYVIGSSQYDLQNYTKSIESLEASLQANPERSNGNEVRLLTARAWSNLDDNSKAAEIVTRVYDESQDPKAAYWLGEFSYKAGKYPAAEEFYQKVLDGDAESELIPDALYGLAWAQSRNGSTAAALKTFDDLINRFPEHSLVNDALIGRGKTRRVAGDYPQAIVDLNRYLESDPAESNRFNGTYERALCHVKLEDWNSAIADLESLSSDLLVNPDLADDVLFELAWAYKKDEQGDKAVRTFQQVADDYENSPLAAESNYHVGQQLYGEEKYDAAIERYRAALAGKPEKKVGELAAYKLAWCHFKKEDYPKSREAFERQTTAYPEGELKPVGLSMIAESHFQLDQHTEAVTAYKVAIPAIVSSGVTNNVRVLAPIHAAQSANKIKDYQSARDYANIVIENHSESPFIAEAWYETGVAEKGLGNRDEAIKAWESAMQASLGKTGARARCMIGETHFEDKNFDDAIIQFKLVINGYGGRDSADEVKPWQAFAAYEAARCYYVQVSDTEDEARRKLLIDKARELFQRLVDDYPNDRLAENARKQISVLESLK